MSGLGLQEIKVAFIAPTTLGKPADFSLVDRCTVASGQYECAFIIICSASYSSLACRQPPGAAEPGAFLSYFAGHARFNYHSSVSTEVMSSVDQPFEFLKRSAPSPCVLRTISITNITSTTVNRPHSDQTERSTDQLERPHIGLYHPNPASMRLVTRPGRYYGLREGQIL